MHYLLLVTMDRRHAKTSTTARRSVLERLYAIPSFVAGEDGQTWSIADWFVIGGRFTGLLSDGRQTTWLPKVYAELTAPRDPHRDLGYEDDAQIVDQVLYDRLLAPYARQNMRYDRSEGHLAFLDLDGDPVAPTTFIARKWLVVVDYHS